MLLLPLIVPGIVLGIALYVFQVEAELATGLPLLGSLGGLIAGHVLIVIPWTVRLVTREPGRSRPLHRGGGAEPRGRSLRYLSQGDAACHSPRRGCGGAVRLRLLLRQPRDEPRFSVGPGRTTLPIAIIQYLEWKIDPTIAAVSVLQIGLIGAAMLVTDRFVRISRVV